MTEASPASFNVDVEGTETGGVLPAPPLEPEPPLDEDDDEPGGGEGDGGEEPDPAEMTEEGIRQRHADLPSTKKRVGRKAGRAGGAGAQPGRVPLAPPRGEPKPPPERVTKVLAQPKDEDSDDPDTWPTQALELWECLLRWLARQNPPIPADRVSIAVSRKLVGPLQSTSTPFSAIRGAAVEAYPPYSASEQLQRYLITTYHSIGGAGKREGCERADYTLGFYWVATGKTIKVGHVEFEAYSVMCAVQERANAFERQLTEERRLAEAAAGGPTGASMAYPARSPFDRASPAQPGYGPAFGGGAAASQGGGDADVMRRLGYLEAVKDEFDRAKAEGRAPREIVPTGSPASAAHAANDEERNRAMVTAAVQEALAAAGIRPQTEEERMTRLITQQTDIITKNVLAVLGPQAGSAGAAGAAGAAVATPAAPPSGLQQVSSLKQQLEEFNALKDALKEAFASEEPDERPSNPPAIHVEDKPKGWMEKATGLLKQLPPGTAGATLAVLGKAFAGSPAGAMLELAAAELRNPSIQAPRGGGGGWGAPPGTKGDGR